MRSTPKVVKVVTGLVGLAGGLAVVIGLSTLSGCGSGKELPSADGFTPDHVSQRGQGLIERTGYRQQQ